MVLKKQLKRLLEERDVTAAQLSRRTGVPKQVLSDWLAGVNPRRIDQVKKVADALGVSLDELCFGDIKNNSKEGSVDIDALIGDQWISGLFEVKLRRVKR